MPEKILGVFFNIWTIWREEFQLKFKDPAEISDLDNLDSFTLFTGVSLSVRLEFTSGPSCSKLG